GVQTCALPICVGRYSLAARGLYLVPVGVGTRRVRTCGANPRGDAVCGGAECVLAELPFVARQLVSSAAVLKPLGLGWHHRHVVGAIGVCLYADHERAVSKRAINARALGHYARLWLAGTVVGRSGKMAVAAFRAGRLT